MFENIMHSNIASTVSNIDYTSAIEKWRETGDKRPIQEGQKNMNWNFHQEALNLRNCKGNINHASVDGMGRGWRGKWTSTTHTMHRSQTRTCRASSSEVRAILPRVHLSQKISPQFLQWCCPKHRWSNISTQTTQYKT